MDSSNSSKIIFNAGGIFVTNSSNDITDIMIKQSFTN